MEVLTPKLKRTRPLPPCIDGASCSLLRECPELAENDCILETPSAAHHIQHFIANVVLSDAKQAPLRQVTQKRVENAPSFDLICDSRSNFLDLWRLIQSQILDGRKAPVVEEVRFVVPVASINGKFLRNRADELNLNTTGRYLPYLLSNELNVSTFDTGLQNWVHASISTMEVLNHGAPIMLSQPIKAQITIHRAPLNPVQPFCYTKAESNESICSDDDMEYMGYTPFDGAYPHLAKLLYTEQASLFLELTQHQAKVRAFCVASDGEDAIGDKKASRTITDALSALQQSVRLKQASNQGHHPASPIVATHPIPLEHSFPFVVKLLYTLARQSTGAVVVVKLSETASVHLRWRHASTTSSWDEYCVLRATGAVSAHDALVKLEAILTEQERLTAGESQFEIEMTRSPGGVTMI